MNSIREVGSSRDYSCSICNGSFLDFTLYWSHIKKFHEISGAIVRIGCQLCRMLFVYFCILFYFHLDEISVGELLLLPYLTSSSSYNTRGNKRKKLPAAESAEYFIQFVSVWFYTYLWIFVSSLAWFFLCIIVLLKEFSFIFQLEFDIETMRHSESKGNSHLYYVWATFLN